MYQVGIMDTAAINQLLDEVADDRTVPRNIRNLIANAKASLNNTKQDMAVRVSGAITLLDDVSNDPNIPVYTRTQIWNIVSLLEAANK